MHLVLGAFHFRPPGVMKSRPPAASFFLEETWESLEQEERARCFSIQQPVYVPQAAAIKEAGCGGLVGDGA